MIFLSSFKKAISLTTLTSFIVALSPMGIAHAVVNITEVTPVPAFTNSSTPTYVFNADGPGNIVYGPGCISSIITTAVTGNNSVVFDFLPDAAYSTCTISVNDGTPGNILSIPTFTVDTLAPMVTPTGPNQTILVGSTYNDIGAQWSDGPNGNGFITAVETVSNVNTGAVGTYSVVYTHVDAAGNTGSATRTVNVIAGAIPTITLIGPAVINLNIGDAYSDSGATANDTEDGDRTAFIVTVNPVDTNTPGSYTITYNVADSNGNNATQVIRTVNVSNGNVPGISLIGLATVNVEQGATYVDAGATAFDAQDGIITASIVTDSGGLDTNVPGTYTITYDVTDSNANPAPTVSRTVIVSDTITPIISLVGSPMIDVLRGQTFVDPGANWTDLADGSGLVMGSGIVNTGAVGTYILNYSYTDVAGHMSNPVNRTVNVILGDVPIISLNGSGVIIVPLGGTYSELGATATDTEDGTLTGITISGSVNTNSVGIYTLVYSVIDSNFNTVTLNRIVQVVDPIAPVVTLNGTGSITMNAGTAFVDLGASWTDNVDGSGVIMGVGSFNPNLAGTYTLSYNYTDVGGNIGNTVTRTITVVGTVSPPSSGAGPGGGGGSAYAGVAPSGIVLNSAPDMENPVDAIIPKIVRIFRTASRESRMSMNSAETFEIKNPITSQVCTNLNVFANDDMITSEYLSHAKYGDNIKSLMMYRGEENEKQTEEVTQRYLVQQGFGILKYNEYFNENENISRAEFAKILSRALSCHYVSSSAPSVYSDVGENAWYTEYINFATENGWIDGFEDGTFRPHDPISRDEAITAISRAIQLDIGELGGSSQFVDTDSDAVVYFTDKGYIEAKNTFIFGASTPITRGEVAHMIDKIFLNIE